MSNLLIEDRPIMFLPMLAKALGSCERAIVLQQIYWLLRQPNSGVNVEGHHWVYGSYEDWARDYFSMWSAHTLAKVIRKLEESKVLVSAQLRARDHDRTKFYRIDHEVLRSMLPDQVASNVPAEVASKPPEEVRSNAPGQVGSIYSTKTSTENTPKRMRPTQAQKGKKSYHPEDYDFDK